MHIDSLYRRLLGADFEVLPRALRTFHDTHERVRASGRMRVVWNTRPAARFMARMMRLPRPGDAVVRVDVQPQRAGEWWTRAFNDHVFRTFQSATRDGLLAERSGPITVRFRLRADQAGFSFEYVDCRLLGMILPKPLAIVITAAVSADADGWNVSVHIANPLVGTIASYGGRIVSEPVP